MVLILLVELQIKDGNTERSEIKTKCLRKVDLRRKIIIGFTSIVPGPQAPTAQ